jgi:hypothetical protein
MLDFAITFDCKISLWYCFGLMMLCVEVQFVLKLVTFILLLVEEIEMYFIFLMELLILIGIQ